jgi:hypothetical protein
MASKIQATVSAAFPGGLNLTEAQDIPIEAYDKIDAVIKSDGQQSTPVQIQPAATEQVKFLLITSNKFSDQLTYSVGAAEADPAQRIKLDWIQMFAGSGMLGLLLQPPQTLHFYNDTGEDAEIQVLVGRTAVVQP